MGHGRSVAVGQAVGGGLTCENADAASQQAWVAAEMEGVPSLDAGIAPPLGLLAPRCVHVGVQRTDTLGVGAGLPDFVQLRIGTTERPGAVERVTAGLEVDRDVQRLPDIAPGQDKIAEAEVMKEGVGLPAGAADQTVGQTNPAMVVRIHQRFQFRRVQRFGVEKIEDLASSGIFHGDADRADHDAAEVQEDAAELPGARGGQAERRLVRSRRCIGKILAQA